MKSERLVFRKFQNNDFDLYIQLVMNEEVMRMITERALSLEEAQEKFENIISINSQNAEIGYYKINSILTGNFIGMGKLVIIENNQAELGYSLLPQNWELGYGTEISNTLIQYAKTLDFIETLLAIIDPKNTASKKILLKGGFSLKEVCKYDNLPAEIYHLQNET